MDNKRFRRLVAQAIDALPENFREALHNIEVLVEDWPTDEQLDYFEDREGLDEGEGDDLLLGLYEGIPLPERDLQNYSGVLPDRITLFRESIDEFCAGDEKEMAEQIKLTLLHEVGHYFGIGDDKLEELGY